VSPLRQAHNVGIMPPHCDSLDGPVVTAARRALDTGNVDVVLPFVPEQCETEVKDVFQKSPPLGHSGLLVHLQLTALARPGHVPDDTRLADQGPELDGSPPSPWTSQ
jgi:Family of unknown function (DUF6448)